MDARCCHSQDSTNSISMSHFNADWALSGQHSTVLMVDNSVEFPVLQMETGSPDLSIGSPPPKSLLFS